MNLAFPLWMGPRLYRLAWEYKTIVKAGVQGLTKGFRAKDSFGPTLLPAIPHFTLMFLFLNLFKNFY